MKKLELNKKELHTMERIDIDLDEDLHIQWQNQDQWLKKKIEDVEQLRISNSNRKNLNLHELEEKNKSMLIKIKEFEENIKTGTDQIETLLDKMNKKKEEKLENEKYILSLKGKTLLEIKEKIEELESQLVQFKETLDQKKEKIAINNKHTKFFDQTSKNLQEIYNQLNKEVEESVMVGKGLISKIESAEIPSIDEIQALNSSEALKKLDLHQDFKTAKNDLQKIADLFQNYIAHYELSIKQLEDSKGEIMLTMKNLMGMQTDDILSLFMQYTKAKIEEVLLPSENIDQVDKNKEELDQKIREIVLKTTDIKTKINERYDEMLEYYKNSENYRKNNDLELVVHDDKENIVLMKMDDLLKKFEEDKEKIFEEIAKKESNNTTENHKIIEKIIQIDNTYKKLFLGTKIYNTYKIKNHMPTHFKDGLD